MWSSLKGLISTSLLRVRVFSYSIFFPLMVGVYFHLSRRSQQLLFFRLGQFLSTHWFYSFYLYFCRFVFFLLPFIILLVLKVFFSFSAESISCLALFLSLCFCWCLTAASASAILLWSVDLLEVKRKKVFFLHTSTFW